MYHRPIFQKHIIYYSSDVCCRCWPKDLCDNFQSKTPIQRNKCALAVCSFPYIHFRIVGIFRSTLNWLLHLSAAAALALPFQFWFGVRARCYATVVDIVGCGLFSFVRFTPSFPHAFGYDFVTDFMYDRECLRAHRLFRLYFNTKTKKKRHRVHIESKWATTKK